MAALTDQTQLTLTLRPHTFDEVIGLEEPIGIIKAKLAKGEVPRAILLSGLYGTGKTTLAHIIARYIQGPFFPEDVNPSVHEVNAANYRKIEHMRALADEAGSYPMPPSTYHVIILDECHKLTGDAMDVLLKELEVPVSPTVWILGTTEPDSINEGVRDRCFKLTTKGMDATQRHELIARAAKVTKYEGDLAVFEKEITRNHVVSPRKIVGAFEQLLLGVAADAAVGSALCAITPEYHDIAFAVLYGAWDRDTLVWGKVPTRSVGAQLLDLENKLKKKKKTEEADDDALLLDDSDTLDSKPEAAKALRAVVGAYLKGRVLPKSLKDGKYKFPKKEDSDRAFKAMHLLATAIPASAYEIQWSGTVALLYRVNQILQER